MHEPVSIPTRLRLGLLGALVVMTSVLSITVAASAASAASAPKGSGAPSSSAQKAFQTCMAQHGVKFTGRRPGARPGGGGGFPPAGANGSFPPGGGAAGGAPGGLRGFGNSKSAKAFAACRSKLPAGGGFGGAGAFKPTAAQQQALITYEQCMSAQGVKISSTATFQTIRALAQADPMAAKACQSDLKGIFGGPPGAGQPGAGSPGGATPPSGSS